ncbi:MAG: PhoPQ-activated pathogenicity-related family protein [Verrucomicrobiota bacterium]
MKTVLPLLGLVAALLAPGCSTPPPAASRVAPVAPAPHSRAIETALDRYVATPDPAYTWKALPSASAGGVTVTPIDLVSQTWLTPGEVNRTTWRHWLMVFRPEKVESSTALLFISGGSNRDQQPPKPSEQVAAIAQATKSVVAELRMVPNQPLVFHGDGEERVEDNLIAYTWDRYLRTGDDRWPARLPMTKAAVRAMDTLTAFTASPAGGGRAVDSFLVAGASKRGWTTWTTAIVDRRVVAICPIVIDVLNMEQSMLHHYQAYGFYAPAVGDYVRQGIMNWMGAPEMNSLRRIEDPFEYRDRLALPKLLMNACGDQFFLPDSSQFYFEQLPGVKYLRYVPNADHSMRGSDAYETLAAWHHATLSKAPLPRFTWQNEADGSIRVRVQDRPRTVRLWQATNPGARDFRLEATGPAWWATGLEESEPGVYVGRATAPSRGWTAYLVELTYDLGGPTPIKFTTQVRVTPQNLPHARPSAPPPRGFLRR